MLNNYRNTIMGLLLGSFSIAHAATDCNQVTEIPVSECKELLNLYNSTNGANWKNKTGWNETNAPCSWFGITCSEGSVSKIDLHDNGNESDWVYGNNLKGQLPNINLPNLQTLYLSSNQLSGSVPDFNLPKLFSLDLSSNQLSGSIPNFTNLPNLVGLGLDENKLTGNIPDFNLPKLFSLNLSLNQLSGNIPNFTNLPSLQHLNLGASNLIGSIPNFTNLPNLVELGLSANQLTGNIPNFTNLPVLKSLRLRENKLTGNIPDFNKLPKIGFLSLDNNQLSGVIPSSFKVSNFERFLTSTTLELNSNCGLTAFDSEQETALRGKTYYGNWDAKNSDCSQSAVCPLVNVSPNLDIHLPHLNYNNMTLSANLRYAPRDGKTLFEVVNYSINSDSCASANLSPDFKLHIPTATFGDVKLWADLQLYSMENNTITFELVKYGNT